MGDRDYHYGVAPQGLLALRLILGDRAMFDLTGRAYYLTGMGGGDPGGTENINRLNMGFTVRIYGRHALGIQIHRVHPGCAVSRMGRQSPDDGNRQPRLHFTWRHPVRCCRVARR